MSALCGNCDARAHAAHSGPCPDEYRSDYVRSERVRGFQPPWHTVSIYACPGCAREFRLRVRGSGLGPGGIRCDCGEVVRF